MRVRSVGRSYLTCLQEGKNGHRKRSASKNDVAMPAEASPAEMGEEPKDAGMPTEEAGMETEETSKSATMPAEEIVVERAWAWRAVL